MPLRDMDREQMWLLPSALDELLPLDHPARFAAEFVDALDKEGWAKLGVEVDGDPMGAPAYHPRPLLSVWLYGFMTGVRSCRKLEAACRDQIPYLWLAGCMHEGSRGSMTILPRSSSSLIVRSLRTMLPSRNGSTHRWRCENSNSLCMAAQFSRRND